MKVYLLLKLAFYFIVLLGVFYILEYGFTFDLSNKLLKPFLLSTLTMTMVFKPKLKRYILFFISACLVLMILAYLLNFLRFSNIVGGFGFSLLVVTMFLYLPQIIKKGHIERF